MDKKTLSLSRKHLRDENKLYGKSFTTVHREEWPHDANDTRMAVLRSKDFLVQMFYEGNGLHRLSVCRTELDSRGGWKADISWEELQRIKFECGFGDDDAVEVYPPEVDVVNVANMRHLWILPERLTFPWRSL